jgi:hypothetical protein
MWKKIHSNRDPRDTVFTELRREFKPQFNSAATSLRKQVETYPRLVFWLMVINISLSAVLSFTVFKHPDPPPVKKTAGLVEPVTGGINVVMQTSRDIHELLQIKKAIDSLSVKKQLTRQDSATLENALDKFKALTNKLNRK